MVDKWKKENGRWNVSRESIFKSITKEELLNEKNIIMKEIESLNLKLCLIDEDIIKINQLEKE